MKVKIKPTAYCENCQNLDPIGEGDHICDEDPTRMPVSEYAPTNDYLWCGGAHFIGNKKAADPMAVGKAARKKTRTK